MPGFPRRREEGVPLQLPNDPVMLMSFVNTRLRDGFDSLDALCDDLGLAREELCERLRRAGFEYDGGRNQFR